jgi:glycosyltransferase involved in cell wall biosynthesis
MREDAMNICLVLGDRSPWDGESALPILAGSLAALTGQVLLLVPDTALLPQEVRQHLTPYARFHVRTGDRLLPVEIERWQSKHVSWFVIGSGDTVSQQPLSSSCFAAACSALIGLVINKEGLKPDWLHIHHWSALPVALLVKKYFRIPYIYSVHSLSFQKTPVKELDGLGILSDREYPLLGEMFFSEHVSGMEAEYVVCEDIGLMAKEWNTFFCAFDGKIIAGLPVVDTDFWGDTGNLPRSARRNGLLAAYGGAENGVTVMVGDSEAISSLLPPGFIAVICAAEPLKKRQQLQAADFYLLTGECTSPRELLAAMAAGCIPVTAESRFAREVVYSEEEWPRHANGYLYNNKKETVTEVLARAAADLRERPEWAATLRQRGIELVKELYGLQSASVFYHKIYCGMADIKLPFVVM